MANDAPREVRLVPEAKRWFESLAPRDARRMALAFDDVATGGPTLGRPRVDRIKGSRIHNLKEVRSPGQHLRALFAFDGDGRAIVLVGGDKKGNWKGWYRENIPVAEMRFERHVKDSGGEYRWHVTGPRTGDRSAQRCR